VRSSTAPKVGIVARLDALDAVAEQETEAAEGE
jgi:hypothetical protein